jgi:hypothetical protein
MSPQGKKRPMGRGRHISDGAGRRSVDPALDQEGDARSKYHERFSKRKCLSSRSAMPRSKALDGAF